MLTTTSILFAVTTVGVLVDRREYAAGMGQHILCIAGEMAPSHDRAYGILKETTREVSWVNECRKATTAHDATDLEAGGNRKVGFLPSPACSLSRRWTAPYRRGGLVLAAAACVDCSLP